MHVVPEPRFRFQKCHLNSATAVTVALAMLSEIYQTHLNPAFSRWCLCWYVAVCTHGLFCDLGPPSGSQIGVSVCVQGCGKQSGSGCGMLASRRAKAVPFWAQLALGTEIGSPWVVPAESPHPLSVGLSSPHDICVPCGISK